MARDGRLWGWTGTTWVPLKIDSAGQMVIDQPIGGGGGAAWTEDASFKIIVPDSFGPPTDDPTFAIALAQEDLVAAPTEAVQLGLPAGNFDDAVAAPSESRSFTMRIWLSGSTATANGVTNVANANGANDAANAVIQSAVAGVASPSITSVLGANVPAGVVITAAIYRGWFQSANNLATSTGVLLMRSIGSLFSDLTMFNNPGALSTVNHLSGTFTYDLVANGVNTAALLASCQMIHQTTDAVAGVTPHVLTVDAGCIELVGAFT